jgi:hypothetical protein
MDMPNNNRSSYFCPNEKCKNHENPEQGFFIKKGYYTTKHNSKQVPCYQCKTCGKKFSGNTFKDTFRQHKPEFNDLIFKFYASNVSQNRLAVNLSLDRKTIVRKIRFLAKKAREVHEWNLNPENPDRIIVNMAQFDEMETHEHTRMKPVTIAMAVESWWDGKTKKYRTGRIIDAVAAPMYYKGRLAPKAQEKYGNREDKSGVARKAALISVSQAAASIPNLRVLTDGKKEYASLIQEEIKGCQHKTICRKDNSGTEFDKMFALNHTCSRVRHDNARMNRETWVTTKTIKGLQDNLDLYIAYYNKYKLC